MPTTTIRISLETKKKMDKTKVIKRESYDDEINRYIRLLGEKANATN